MHAVAFTYPDSPTPTERKQYIDFFKSLEAVIPCPSCRQHYGDHISSNPIEADNTEDLSRWVYNLHDKVNKRNNKTSPSYEEVKDMYTGFNNDKHQALLKKSEAEQRRLMADPLFSHKEQSIAETTDSVSDGGNDKHTKIVLVLAIVAGMAFMYMRRKERQKQNDKKRV